MSVVLGIITVLAAFLFLTPLAIFAIIVFAFVIGWKVYSLSRPRRESDDSYPKYRLLGMTRILESSSRRRKVQQASMRASA